MILFWAPCTVRRMVVEIFNSFKTIIKKLFYGTNHYLTATNINQQKHKYM